jgi:uncharacterized protein
MPTRSEPWPPGTPCWVDLGAPDVAVSTAFYGAVLGWSFFDSGAEFGHYNICQVGGHAAAAIGPKQDPSQPTVWTLYLASEDADATAAAITANGGTVLVDPFDVPANGRMTFAMDPAGAAFGVWQAGGTIGAEVYNEPGALTWKDARLTDPEAARAFYTAVFGYSYQTLDGAPGDYTTFHLGGDALGGMGGMMGAPAGTPSHWVAYFAVADVDAAVAAATAGGGALLGDPMDTSFGRMAFLTDPDGAVFALAGLPPS